MKITLALILLMVSLPVFSSSIDMSLVPLQYYEPSGEEFSADMDNPSELGELSAGQHYVLAFLGQGDVSDVFSVTIADGYRLSGLYLRRFYGDVDSNNLPSLCMSEDPFGGSCGLQTTLSGDLLDVDLLSEGSFDALLSENEFVFGISLNQDGDPEMMNERGLLAYKFELEVTPVPLPAPALLLVSGLISLFGWQRFQKR